MGQKEGNNKLNEVRRNKMHAFEEIIFLASEQRTADAESAVFDMSKYQELTLFLDITAQGSYSDETLDIKIYSYDPASRAYIEVDAMTQVTGDKGSGFQDKKIITSGLGNKIKIKSIGAGTSVDYTFSVGGVAKRFA